MSDDEDYFDEKYPSANDKYNQLKDRLKAVEIQAILGLDFDDLGLIFGVVIPHKFKIPVFVKYDGVSYPKLHLKSYVRKIQPHTTDKKLWIHFFQESLGWDATRVVLPIGWFPYPHMGRLSYHFLPPIPI